MSARRLPRGAAIGLTVAAFAGAIALLRPWTIVPIKTAAPASFEPIGYVTSNWETRVLPAAEATAIDLQALMNGQAAAGDKRALFVKGTATVAEVDRRSRVGLARLTLPQTKDGRGAAIQIGPVIRGTALRDALAFIRFTDFVNQLDFASVASALNDRVVSAVLPAAADIGSGAEVTFVGAVPIAPSGPAVEIVPVKLEIARGQR